MIQLNHVTKLYGLVIGVNDITLELEPGAYGLVGPNGSGKSTLLNLITGQLKPTLGTVRTLGEDPWNQPELLRRLGLCPASDLHYPHVSGWEWVCYLLELQGYSPAEARKRAGEALEQVGMSQAMHRPLGSYSRGMQQRTKLAQAFAHQPDLLILDEPFNGLDPVGRYEMTEYLRRWIKEGRSLLLASHILHEVEAVTHSFLLICGGRLLASGAAEEVRTLLAEIPHEISFRCNDPRRLAQRLLQEDVVEGLRFADEGETLLLATRTPLQIYQELPRWLKEEGLTIDELRSPDESLQSLFDSLLRLHRGESFAPSLAAPATEEAPPAQE